MSDLAVIFKGMIEARGKAGEARISRQDFLKEKKRADNLQEMFNSKMRVLNPVEKNEALNELIAAGLLPEFAGRLRDVFNGTFDSIITEHREVAKDVTRRIPKELIAGPDKYAWCSNELKVLGMRDTEYVESMAEIGKILK